MYHIHHTFAQTNISWNKSVKQVTCLELRGSRKKCEYRNVVKLTITVIHLIVRWMLAQCAFKVIWLYFTASLVTELSVAVHINSLAEKNSIQPWMNVINVCLVMTQHPLSSHASTSFTPLVRWGNNLRRHCPMSPPLPSERPHWGLNPGHLRNNAAC